MNRRDNSYERYRKNDRSRDKSRNNKYSKRSTSRGGKGKTILNIFLPTFTLFKQKKEIDGLMHLLLLPSFPMVR